MQIDGQGTYVRPILHWGLYSHWKASQTHLLARWATYLLHLMFSHQQSHLRQVVHLSAFLKLPSDALQRLLAVSAELGTMTHHLISAGYLHQGAPSMSWL